MMTTQLWLVNEDSEKEVEIWKNDVDFSRRSRRVKSSDIFAYRMFVL